MPRIDPIRGSYAHEQIIQPLSFQVNGASAPTVLRDGTDVSVATGKLFSVTRASAGLYTIALDSDTPWPTRPFLVATVDQAAAPTAQVEARVVVGSYNPSTKSFQVQLITAAGAASDGDAGDRVTVLVMGSYRTIGTDPA